MKQLIEVEGKLNLRTRLKQEAVANADRDLEIAAEWFPLEEEAAQLAETGRPKKRSPKRT